MSTRKLRGLFLGLAFCAAAEGAAPAIDVAPAPQVPLSMAARPRIFQSAQPAAKPVSLQVGSAAPGALPGASPATLWQFMGIPQGIQNLQGAATNRNGNRPGREPTPPMKAIADPSNLDPGKGAAINKAAEIKQKEDLAPQKIKALKYLATIGCGCYPGVEEAFAKSLKFGDECTEEVRYEAALAIEEAAESNCAKCGKSCCCTAEMIQLLNDVATGRDAEGCFLEPSARVREAACQALLACRRRVPVYAAPAPVPVVPPTEIPGETIPREPMPGEVVPKESTAQSKRRGRSNDPNSLMNDILGDPANEGRRSSTEGGSAAATVATRKSVVNQESGESPRAAAPRTVLIGSVVAVDAKTSTVDLEFLGPRQPTVGSQFGVHHDYALSSNYLGRLEIVFLARNGRAIARPLGRLDFAKLGKGDRVTGRVTTGDDEQSTSSAASHSLPSKAPRSCVTPPPGEGLPPPPAELPLDATTAAPALPAGANRRWTNAALAKPAATGNRPACVAPWEPAAPAAATGIVGGSIADKTARLKSALFGGFRGNEKRVADVSAPDRNLQPPKTAGMQCQATARKPAATLSNAWLHLTRPARGGLDPSPAGRVSASAETGASSVSGIALMEE